MGHEIEFSRTKFRPQLTPPRRSLPTSSADGGTGCLRPELTHVTERPWKTENTRMVGQQLQSILAAQSEFTGLPVFLPLKQLRDFCLTDSSLLRADAEPLARGFYCFLSILPDQTTVSLLCRTCVHVHTHTHTHTHTYLLRTDCIWNTVATEQQKLRMKHLWTQIGVLRTVDCVFWLFITGAPAWRWLNQYVTLERTFYSILL